MKQIKFSETLSLSQIVYGVWRWNGNQSNLERRKIIDICLNEGIDSFDHADIYNDYANEAYFGEILKKEPSLRKEIKIITKCGIQLISNSRPENYVKHYNYCAEHIITSVDNSLKNLHTDFLDLLLLHRPSPLLNIHETATTLEKLIESGKVRHIGVSNFSPSQFSLLQSALSSPLITNQIELNLFHHFPLTDGTIDFLYERNIKPMIWSPLAGGQIFNSENELMQKTLKQVNEKYNTTTEALCLSWLIKHPANLVPVIGTNNPKRIITAAAAEKTNLTLQDWFLLYEVALGKPVP
jgi:predicted oxidoreductase